MRVGDLKDPGTGRPCLQVTGLGRAQEPVAQVRGHRLDHGQELLWGGRLCLLLLLLLLLLLVLLLLLLLVVVAAECFSSTAIHLTSFHSHANSVLIQKTSPISVRTSS